MTPEPLSTLLGLLGATGYEDCVIGGTGADRATPRHIPRRNSR
jgi:hypothetical protein